jgi:4-alpha-glucanotransferase
VHAREAGILLPLFSVRSARQWGIGEMADLAAVCAWVARAGHRRLQLLPLLDMAPGERSPYAALSAFALDPVYLALHALEDFLEAGGEAALPGATRARLDDLRAASTLDYDAVRAVKRQALEIAFARFRDAEERRRSPRAAAFARFRDEAAAWLGPYTVYRAAKERREERAWSAWEEPLRRADAAAVAAERTAAADAVHFHAWVQWCLDEQWTEARRAAAAVGVALDGDLAFGVSTDSADAWACQEVFRFDVSLGAPPDAFSPEGQDWGLPAYRWEAMEADGFAWLRRRIARTGHIFDGCRLDHVVGYYRMYVRPQRDEPAFEPPEERAQRDLGERLLGIVRDAGGPMRVAAEDLGVVPDFVRASLARLGIPGYRVLRWEVDDGAFRDPRAWPARSIATSGTHDTSTLAAWWEDELDEAGRAALTAVPPFARLAAGASATFTSAVRDALLEGLYASGSMLVLLPLEDAYGGRGRINVPGTMGPGNWGYRMPWSVEELDRGEAADVARRLRALAERTGRRGTGASGRGAGRRGPGGYREGRRGRR